MHKRIISILVLIYLFSFVGMSQDEIVLSKKAIKRMDKVIEKTWDKREILLTKIELTISFSPSEGPIKQFYKLISSEEAIGYLVISSAKGRYDYFDYMVQYDNKLNILEINVLTYRSDHGYEITNKGWLNQFKGSQGCELNYGKEIDAISGATKSASSITYDIGVICKELQLIVTNQ